MLPIGVLLSGEVKNSFVRATIDTTNVGDCTVCGLAAGEGTISNCFSIISGGGIDYFYGIFKKQVRTVKNNC